MYSVDDKDRVRKLGDVPQSSVGAPLPFVMSDESQVVLAYYCEVRDPNWDGSYVRIVGPVDADEPIALVTIRGCQAHMFGSPNDEAFAGHPLAARGLHPYGAFEVESSSWVRSLERMNSVHPRHCPGSFRDTRHLVFAFHDSVFECCCRSFEIHRLRGSIASIAPAMLKMFAWDAG